MGSVSFVAVNGYWGVLVLLYEMEFGSVSFTVGNRLWEYQFYWWEWTWSVSFTGGNELGSVSFTGENGLRECQFYVWKWTWVVPVLLF